MPNKPSYVWTETADGCLLTALLDLQNGSAVAANNGFKGGFLKNLEKKLAIDLPDEKILADPHIKSRLKTMRKNYAIVHDMLYGTCSSGFGFDSTTNCIVAEAPVWDAYISSHKNDGQFINKALPLFDIMSKLFGHDRATGASAESAADMATPLEDDNITQGDSAAYLPEIDWMNDADFLSHIAYAGVPGSADTYAFPDDTPAQADDPSPPTKKAKKNSTTRELGDIMIDLGASMRETITKIGTSISEAIRIEDKVGDLQDEFFKQILAMNGLTTREKTKACRVMREKEALMKVFFQVDEDDRLEYVRDVVGES